ncbi:HAMP domain-containing protein [Marinivivus vitaminiproducens]|uniref:HAMP domain-containing protein n=1 Tax=Marinivivus vitaminiproducens TaxID=3035935 RepID=UPI0027A4B932|nr:hypothetical protein P4R82_19225 [Geminicoccaceae bacterium SCSIO 64248]
MSETSSKARRSRRATSRNRREAARRLRRRVTQLMIVVVSFTLLLAGGAVYVGMMINNAAANYADSQGRVSVLAGLSADVTDYIAAVGQAIAQEDASGLIAVTTAETRVARRLSQLGANINTQPTAAAMLGNSRGLPSGMPAPAPSAPGADADRPTNRFLDAMGNPYSDSIDRYQDRSTSGGGGWGAGSNMGSTSGSGSASSGSSSGGGLFGNSGGVFGDRQAPPGTGDSGGVFGSRQAVPPTATRQAQVPQATSQAAEDPFALSEDRVNLRLDTNRLQPIVASFERLRTQVSVSLQPPAASMSAEARQTLRQFGSETLRTDLPRVVRTAIDGQVMESGGLMQEINSLRQYLSGGAAILAVLLITSVIVMTGRLATRIENGFARLAEGMSAVARGHLEHKVRRGNGDDFGALAQRFNLMAFQLRQQRQTWREEAASDGGLELGGIERINARLLSALGRGLHGDIALVEHPEGADASGRLGRRLHQRNRIIEELQHALGTPRALVADRSFDLGDLTRKTVEGPEASSKVFDTSRLAALTVLGDKQRIETVLRLLLEHALGRSAHGQTIRLTTWEEDESELGLLELVGTAAEDQTDGAQEETNLALVAAAWLAEFEGAEVETGVTANGQWRILLRLALPQPETAEPSGTAHEEVTEVTSFGGSGDAGGGRTPSGGIQPSAG